MVGIMKLTPIEINFAGNVIVIQGSGKHGTA